MKARLKCWDSENEKWVYENDESEFTYSNEKWAVRYTQEKTIHNEGIEIDAPVWVDVEAPQVFVYFFPDVPQIGFTISLPI